MGHPEHGMFGRCTVRRRKWQGSMGDHNCKPIPHTMAPLRDYIPVPKQLEPQIHSPPGGGDSLQGISSASQFLCEILCALCLVFLRICTSIRWAVPLSLCTPPEDFVNDKSFPVEVAEVLKCIPVLACSLCCPHMAAFHHIIMLSSVFRVFGTVRPLSAVPSLFETASLLATPHGTLWCSPKEGSSWEPWMICLLIF